MWTGGAPGLAHGRDGLTLCDMLARVNQQCRRVAVERRHAGSVLNFNRLTVSTAGAGRDDDAIPGGENRAASLGRDVDALVLPQGSVEGVDPQTEGAADMR